MQGKNTFVQNQKGFSLVELLIFSLLLLLVLSAAYIVLFGAVSSCETGESIAEIHQNARMAIDRMVSELRECNGIFDDSTCTQIHFLDSSGENRLYKYVSDTQRINYEVTNTLADYVSDFSLTYYQNGTTVTASPYDEVNRVKIEMEVEKDGIKKNFSSSAKLRNK